jgi:hypothetical protein
MHIQKIKNSTQKPGLIEYILFYSHSVSIIRMDELKMVSLPCIRIQRRLVSSLQPNQTHSQKRYRRSFPEKKEKYGSLRMASIIRLLQGIKGLGMEK